MLCLTLKVGADYGSTIKIGENVFVKILASSGNKVRVGVIAPTEIPVVRDDAVNKASKERFTERNSP